MKPRWLNILLIVSLVGNAAELVLYARAKWIKQREMNQFFKMVQDRAETWTIRAVVQSYQQRVWVLEQRENRWALDLYWQDFQQPPDTAIDRIALDSIASITRQEYDLIYQSRRALPQVEDARLRKRMERRWRGQMGLGN